mmetsp:Transcript_5755/g.8395  ORF Transcript_5755/g.8395 Transcript_5755/m.8395 type:complete len:433 (-) Transcript_5755:963-2261(-)
MSLRKKNLKRVSNSLNPASRPALAVRKLIKFILVTLFLCWTYSLYNLIITTHGDNFFPLSATMRHQSQLQANTNRWDWEFIHIVNTRFMQDQGKLSVLARARLELFKEFCLPTMINQTSQQFLWIIRTDPELDPDVLKDLVSLLRPYPHFFLIASNYNFLIGKNSKPGGWRGGEAAKEILESKIFCGDIALLRGASKYEVDQIVLETRLDSDDGLNINYLETVQKFATKAVISNMSIEEELANSEQAQHRVNWMYWCAKWHVEWHYNGKLDQGQVNAIKHETYCITAGLTVAFGVGVQIDSILKSPHHKLYSDVGHFGGCGLSRNKDCLVMVDDLNVAAIRSRTPTSAGMKNIDPINVDPEITKSLWNHLREDFAISDEGARYVNQYIHDNLNMIALENEMGQCTEGHSCKESSKEKLRRIREDIAAQKVKT